MKILLMVLFPIFFSVTADAQSSPISNCVESEWGIRCPYQKTKIKGGRTFARNVYYSLPKTKMPKDGYPAAVIYQGSYFTVKFERSRDLPFGAINEIGLIRELLDRGFAVLAPRAFNSLFWESNVAGSLYEKSSDFAFLTNFLKSIDDGKFGQIDTRNLFAVGISSGGYNTSRMAVSFAGKFRALAVHSASYASCLGPLCTMPEKLPVDHPPTLLLHGRKDSTVPLNTAENYDRLLRSEGIPSELFIDDEAGHEWLDSAPKLVTDWFQKYLQQ